MLKATTLAFTVAPVVKLNGDARRVDAGIVHMRLDITDELLTPSQLVVSCYHVLDEVSI